MSYLEFGRKRKMAIKVGISGFGRIARVVIRAAMDMPEIEIAGINVRNADLEYLVYMFEVRYDFRKISEEPGPLRQRSGNRRQKSSRLQ